MSSPHSRSKSVEPVTWLERSAFLLGRLTIIFAMVYTVIVFHTLTWRHYSIPKSASFQFLMLILLACWAIIAFGHRFIRSGLSTSAGLFLMISMISCLVAVNLTEAWETVTFMAACMILAVLVPKFFIRMRDFEVLVYILGILCILVDVYALAQKFNWPMFFNISEKFGIHKYTHKPVSFMGNENYTAEFLNIAIPMCFLMIFAYRKKPAELVFYSFVTLLNLIAMYYIDCNASYMGFVVAIPVIAGLLIKYKLIPWMVHAKVIQVSRPVADRWFRHAIVVGVLLVAIGGTAIASFDNKVRFKINEIVSWVDTDGDHRPDGVASFIFRLQCIDAAMRSIVDVPLFGIGAGNFKVNHPLYETQLERKVLGEETLARKVHNDHVYHAVEFGIFGLFAWYLIITVAVYAIFRSLMFLQSQEDSERNAALTGMTDHKRHLTPFAREFFYYLQLGILAGIIVAMVSCMFGHTFVIPSSAVMFWLVVGLGVAIYQKLNRYERGIPMPVYGTTPEPLTPVQRYTKLVPDWLRWIVLFALVLPFGLGNTYQWVGEAWLKYGMNMSDMKNYSGMFYSFERAKKIYPYQMEIYYILGRYYIDTVVEIDSAMKSNSLENLAALRIWVPRSNLTPEQQIQELENLRRTMIEEGIVTLQTDIFMNPNYKWAHNNLGVLYDRMPNYTLSRLAYDRVLALDKEQIYAHYNLGLGYLMQGDYDKAVDGLQMALVVDPSRTEIYRFLARAFIERADYSRALSAADKFLGYSIRDELRNAMNRNVHIPVETLSAITGSLEQGDLLKAMNLSQNYISFEDNPIQADSLRELHRIYLRSAHELIEKGTDPELAKRSIQMAEKTYSVPEVDMFYYYGEIYKALGESEKAIEHYNNYLRAKPNDYGVRRVLAQEYATVGNAIDAVRAYEPIVKDNPDNHGDLVNYARLLLSAGYQWNEVRKLVIRAIEVGGDTAKENIIDPKPGNYLNQFLDKDPGLQAALGTIYLQKAGVEPIPPQADPQPQVEVNPESVIPEQSPPEQDESTTSDQPNRPENMEQPDAQNIPHEMAPQEPLEANGQEEAPEEVPVSEP